MVHPFRETVAALKHDLGKYVAWRCANLDDSAWDGPLEDGCVEALTRDVLATRSRDGSDEPAWSVWDRLTRELERPFLHPELSRVAAAVDTLRRAEPVLRANDRAGIAVLRTQIRGAQQIIRRELAALTRRLARRSET